MVHLETIGRFDRIAPLTDRPDHPTDEVVADGPAPLAARGVDELCGAEDEDEDEETERDRQRRGSAHQHRFADADFAVDSARNYHGVGEWR